MRFMAFHYFEIHKPLINYKFIIEKNWPDHSQIILFNFRLIFLILYWKVYHICISIFRYTNRFIFTGFLSISRSFKLPSYRKTFIVY
jgi:hypothetical protein